MHAGLQFTVLVFRFFKGARVNLIFARFLFDEQNLAEFQIFLV